ncbi:hypothetical protein C8Q72DRAFT_198906 [Fomitopsis betulina]|nr:hypothetical protein C8Q72DRAFT_198906 [Fomitopsis betulina]
MGLILVSILQLFVLHDIPCIPYIPVAASVRRITPWLENLRVIHIKFFSSKRSRAMHLIASRLIDTPWRRHIGSSEGHEALSRSSGEHEIIDIPTQVCGDCDRGAKNTW